MSIGYTEKVREWLIQKQIPTTCPTCGKDDWVVQALLGLSAIEARIGGAMKETKKGYPAAMVVCNHCQSIRFFMAYP